METNKKKSFFEYFQLKENDKTKKYQYLFNIYNPLTDGLVFLLTILIVPLISLFLFRFIGHMGEVDIDGNLINSDSKESYLNFGYQLIIIIFAIIGIIYFRLKDNALFNKSGIFIVYAFLIVPLVISLIPSIIVLLIFEDDYLFNTWAMTILLWAQIIAEVIIIGWALMRTTDLKNRIIATFKSSWISLLIVTIVGTIVMVGICIFAWSEFVKLFPSLDIQSNNQGTLENPISESSGFTRVFYIFTLIILTVFVAPLTEEIVSRSAWYTGTGNRTIGWITSAIFFAMLHVSSGDVENILNYFIAGLILSSIFNIGRGNVTYSWLVHAGYNLTAMILILVINL